MDINYYKEKYEPINGEWYIKELLGEGSYGKVFRIERSDISGTYTAALKIITIPKSQQEIENIRLSFQDENSVTQYFRELTQKLVEEFKLMAQLKGNSNIVSYEDHKIVEHEDGVGYDVLIRMELLTPLYTRLKDKLTEKDIVKIGIDVCKALETCHNLKIVHRDIKPENIFLSPLGDYKIGDFGVAKTMSNEMTVMTTTGTYTYMAPELKKGQACSANVDIYSLGMVMYKLLNYNRDPFLPLPPATFNFNEKEQAYISRMKGEKLPEPVNAGEKLAKIILKACDYNPKKRYSTATQMREELESIPVKELNKEVKFTWDESVSDSSIEKTRGLFDVVNEEKDVEIPIVEKDEKKKSLKFILKKDRNSKEEKVKEVKPEKVKKPKEKKVKEEKVKEVKPEKVKKVKPEKVKEVKPEKVKKPKEKKVKEETGEKKKSKALAVFLTCFFLTSWLGLHDRYLGNKKSAKIKLCTLNFLFIFGWLFDSFLTIINKYRPIDEVFAIVKNAIKRTKNKEKDNKVK